MAVKPTCFCDPGPNVMGFAAQVGAGIGRSRFGFGLRSERNKLIYIKSTEMLGNLFKCCPSPCRVVLLPLWVRWPRTWPGPG
jgi:hypothetical protein